MYSEKPVFNPSKIFYRMNLSNEESQKHGGPPESPTTARELDFDDEPHEPLAPNPKQAPILRTENQAFGEDVPPPKPPRPLPPIQQAENTLKEAFPTIDVAVIKAVLRASRGNVEPAFDALLGTKEPACWND